jgi:hypothetical protein
MEFRFLLWSSQSCPRPRSAAEEKEGEEMTPFDVITIVFITLKLTGVIAWSWWWVTAPTWLGFCVCFLAFIGIVGLSEWAKRKNSLRPKS